MPWLPLPCLLTWGVSWTVNACSNWSTIQIPIIGATSAAVVGVIMERQGPWGIRTNSSPTAAAFTGPLTLRAALSFLKTHSAHLKMRRVRVVSWLDHPWITAATSGFIGIIMERLSPGRTAAPTGARGLISFALTANASPLPEAEAILGIVWNFLPCFDSPLVFVAQTSTTCII